MLKELLIRSEELTAWVPWAHGMEFELCYIGRPELEAMGRAHTRLRMVKGRPTEQLDEEGYSAALVARAVRGWRGVSVAALSKVMPIAADGDGRAELAYSAEDMALIAHHAYGFADWLIRQLTDIELYRREKLEAEVKN